MVGFATEWCASGSRLIRKKWISSCLACFSLHAKFEVHLCWRIFTWYYFLELSGRHLYIQNALLTNTTYPAESEIFAKHSHVNQNQCFRFRANINLFFIVVFIPSACLTRTRQCGSHLTGGGVPTRIIHADASEHSWRKFLSVGTLPVSRTFL